MVAGTCLKYGKVGYIGKNCRIGCRYDPAAAAVATPVIATLATPKTRQLKGQRTESISFNVVDDSGKAQGGVLCLWRPLGM